MAFPCKTPHKNNKNTQTERITTNVSLRMCVCYVKILEIDKLAAFLNSCLPNPLGFLVSYFVPKIRNMKNMKNIRYIDLLLANQIANIIFIALMIIA